MNKKDIRLVFLIQPDRRGRFDGKITGPPGAALSEVRLTSYKLPVHLLVLEDLIMPLVVGLDMLPGVPAAFLDL